MSRDNKNVGTLEYVLTLTAGVFEGAVGRCEESGYDYKDVASACKAGSLIVSALSARHTQSEVQQMQETVEEFRRMRDELRREIDEARKMGLRVDMIVPTTTMTQ